MNNDEVLRVQTYLRLKFSNDMLTLKRGAKDDMVEVFMEDEFIGTLFRDDEDGELCGCRCHGDYRGGNDDRDRERRDCDWHRFYACVCVCCFGCLRWEFWSLADLAGT